MKSFKYIIPLLILFSCNYSTKEKNNKNLTDPPSNVFITKTTPKVVKDSLIKTKLFLDYNSNISKSKFNEITEKLIANGIVHKVKNAVDENEIGGRDKFYYLFPYCKTMPDGWTGGLHDAYEIRPVFKGDLLKSIKINDIGSGMTTSYKNREVYCIYKNLIEKYDIDLKMYEGKTTIKYSKWAVNNTEYDPIDKIKLKQNKYNTSQYTYIKVPEYLIDRNSHLMPNETKTIYKHDNKIPKEIATIVVDQGDKILLINHNWEIKSKTKYSLADKKGYNDIDFEIIINNTYNFIRNSKLKYHETSFHLNVFLEYLTRKEYLNRLKKKADEETKQKTGKNVPLREISNEL
jgi:2-hydroxy-3-keto-5-methylthiopentenyl-1-phosphate phosphatase